MHLLFAFKSWYLSGLLLPAITLAEETQYFVRLRHVDPKDQPYFDRNGFHAGITREATPKASLDGNDGDDGDDEDGAAGAKPKEPVFDLAVGMALPEVASKQSKLTPGNVRTFSFVKRQEAVGSPRYNLRPTHADKLPGPGKTSKQIRLGLRYRLVPGWNEYNWGHQQDMLSIEYRPISEDNLFRHELDPARVLFLSPKDYQERVRACVQLGDYQYSPPGETDYSPQSAPIGQSSFHQGSPGSSPVHLVSPSHQHDAQFQHSGSFPPADYQTETKQSQSYEAIPEVDPAEQDKMFDGEDVHILLAQKHTGQVHLPELWSCRRVKLVLEPIPEDWIKPKTAAEQIPSIHSMMNEITLIKDAKEAEDEDPKSIDVPSSMSHSLSKYASESSNANSLSKHPSESGSGEKKSGGGFGWGDD